MTLSIAELAAAREQVAELLNELGLEAYLFEIEPGPARWQLTVECAIDAEGRWERVTCAIAPQRFDAGLGSAPGRRALLSELRERLSACKRRDP